MVNIEIQFQKQCIKWNVLLGLKLDYILSNLTEFQKVAHESEEVGQSGFGLFGIA